jgi:hypothetical protein
LGFGEFFRRAAPKKLSKTQQRKNLENAMELLDRYVTAVGKHLPRKTRADIEAEIRSTLQDMLDDHSRETGRPVDEAMVKDVLVEYGAPEKVAATYQTQSYLIGPRMYPIFWLVIRIVFAVLTTLFFIGLGIRIGMGPGTMEAIVSQVGKSILEYFQGLMTAFGNIVLILAILERVLPAVDMGKELKEGEPSWDPAALMKEPEPDEVKAWEPILAILFTTLGLAIFNFYPQLISITPSLNNLGKEPVVFVPILSDAFFRYLPWINLIWGLEIVLNLVLLRTGRWTLPTRISELVIKLFGILLANAMLMGPSLLALTANDLIAFNMDASSAAVLVNLFNQMIRVALVIAIVAGGFDLIKGIYRLVVQASKPKAINI